MREEDLVRAKSFARMLENVDVPKFVKGKAVLEVALGVDGDVVVRNIVEEVSYIETAKAEKENPVQPFPADYSDVEKTVAEMLTENTGAHVLDSGGAYGRHWERNRRVSDFRRLPPFEVDCYSSDEISFTLNLFHYLTTFLERDQVALDLERRLYEFAELPENRGLAWLTVMEKFARECCEDYSVYGPWNSYNWENLLSQVIQGITLENDDSTYWILQVHNGCDVRGGYTRPRVFKVKDFEAALAAQSDVNAGCGCMTAYSDDCGYHWYGDGCRGYSLPEHWVHDGGSIVCRRCGEKVLFWPSLDY
ncbi:MAG: hypothetical protein QXI42_11255 [Thermoproteota archaeon]